MPLSDRARERLEQTALHPGKSAEDRRAASDLRRVIYSTRSMPPSAQSDLVRPFVNHPTGKEARAAAALTRDPDFRKASTSERELMASVFPSTSPATARALPALTRQLSQTNLSRAEREQVLRHACSEQRDAPTREATRDVMRALKGQPEAAKSALLEPFTKPWLTEARAEGAQALVKSPAWKQLGPTERTQLAQVFSEARGEYDGLRSVKLLSQKPERLMDRDATGGTLLSNLARLAKGPLHPGVGEARRGELMRGVLQETARAYEVNQSVFGTCTVTSMQYELVRDNPAEYARIMAGLAGPNGRVDMRGGGTLELQADSLPQNALQGRSFSEALFQSSLMEFANGVDEYHVQGPNGDESISPIGNTYQGQYGDSMVRAVSALFGRQFAEWGTNDQTRDAQLDFLRKYQPKGPNDPVLIAFFTSPDAQAGAHAVTFVKVEGDRVFFRNPWGPTADPKGTEEEFGARVEKGSTGLYSFSLEQFRERVYALTVPSEAAGFGGRAVA
ncbi:hypothetical protein HMI49_34855 [Corallococcus exercitus]|uniref:Uncharacterized protein n=1 Tax=Corallococcus exercitus TaxID=2316736 RepID=A0A7Y4NUW6_9BACT|nr:hypothetical protein [Corallococcus exercitus]